MAAPLLGSARLEAAARYLYRSAAGGFPQPEGMPPALHAQAEDTAARLGEALADLVRECATQARQAEAIFGATGEAPATLIALLTASYPPHVRLALQIAALLEARGLSA